jgi:hypothetical protein
VDEGNLGSAESQGSQASIPEHSQTIEEMMHCVSGRPDVRGLSSRVKSRTGFATGVHSLRCVCVLSHRYNPCRVSLYRDPLYRSLLAPPTPLCRSAPSLLLPPSSPPCRSRLAPLLALCRSPLTPPSPPLAGYSLLLTRHVSIPIVIVFLVRPQGSSACMDHFKFKSEDILRLES